MSTDSIINAHNHTIAQKPVMEGPPPSPPHSGEDEYGILGKKAAGNKETSKESTLTPKCLIICSRIRVV